MESLRKPLIILSVAVVLMAIAGIVGYGIGISEWKHYGTEKDTVTFRDTIKYYAPAASASNQVKTVTKYLPVSKEVKVPSVVTDTLYVNGDTIYVERYTEVPLLVHDSVYVDVPIVQKTFSGADYRAYVSGYEPNLDSIMVFPKTSVIKETVTPRTKHWHIGLTGGYGYGFTSKQAEPYIGVGITYSILSF